MANKYKVQVLKEVLKIFEGDKADGRGLCFWLKEKSNGEILVYTSFHTYKDLPRLKKYKPRNISWSSYWFPLNKKGNQKRIKILKALIKYYSARSGKKYAKSRTRTK